MVTDNNTKSIFDFTNLKQFDLTFASEDDLLKFYTYKEEFKTYYFLNMNGRPVVMTNSSSDIGIEYEYSSIKDFKDWNKEKHFNVVGARDIEKRYFADVWLETTEFRTRYEKCVFNPAGNTSSKHFNFWTGSIEPRKGDVSKFLFHMDNLIVGTKEQKEHLIKSIAYAIKNPHVQTGTSIAMRGKPGSGKTTVSMIFEAIYPNHCMTVDDVEHLFGFNAETIHKKYFFMEESVWGGNKSSEGKLKNAITAKSRNIKIKNVTGMSMKNYAFYIFTSNEDWMVPVGPGDRRFNVFDCSDTLTKIPGYFDEFYEWLEGEGKHAILDYLLNEVDLTDFDPRKTIDTKAKTDLKTLSLRPVEKFLYNILSGEIDYEPIIESDWNAEVRITRLDMFEYFKTTSSKSMIEQGEFSRKLAAIFGFVTNWKDNWKDKKKGGFYKLPSKQECRELFAAHLKEEVDALFPDGGEPDPTPPTPPQDKVTVTQAIEKTQAAVVVPVVVAPPGTTAVPLGAGFTPPVAPPEKTEFEKAILEARKVAWVKALTPEKEPAKKLSSKLAFMKKEELAKLEEAVPETV